MYGYQQKSVDELYTLSNLPMAIALNELKHQGLNFLTIHQVNIVFTVFFTVFINTSLINFRFCSPT